MTEAPSFREKWLTIAASATGAVAAGIAGSYIGRLGTIAGLAFGSMFSSTIATLAEQRYRKAAKVARNKYSQMRKRKDETQKDFEKRVRSETSMIPVIRDEEGKQKRSIPWKTISVTAGIGVIASFAFIIGFRLAVPAAANVPAFRVTDTGGKRHTPSQTPSPVVTTTPTPEDSTPSPAFSASPTATATPTPTLTPVVTPTVTPSQSPSPFRRSPSPSSSPAPSPTTLPAPTGTPTP